MTSHYSVLLFNADTFNPFFTALGLLLGAVGLGLGYGAVKLFNTPSTGSGSKTVTTLIGIILLIGAISILGTAALCGLWVAD